eukprot:PhF_6_TR36332/c0_g1_i2/m.53200
MSGKAIRNVMQDLVVDAALMPTSTVRRPTIINQTPPTLSSGSGGGSTPLKDPLVFTVGEKIEALWGGKWWAAQIVGINQRSTGPFNLYDVQYTSDSMIRKNRRPDEIRHIGQEAAVLSAGETAPQQQTVVTTPHTSRPSTPPQTTSLVAAGNNNNGGEYQQLKEKYNAATLRISQLESELTTVQRNLTREAKIARDDLEASEKAKESAVKELEKLKSSMDDTTSGLKGKLAEMKATNDLLVQDSAKLRHSSEAQKRELDIVTASNEENKRRLKEALDTIATLKEEIERLNKESRAASDVHEGVKTKLATITTERDGLVKQIGTLKAANVKIDQECKDIAAQNVTLREGISAAQSKTQSLEKELQKLSDALKEALTDRDRVVKEHKGLEAEAQKLQSERDHNASSFDQAAAAAEQLHVQLVTANDTNRNLLAEITQLQQDSQAKEKEIKRLKSKLDELGNEKESIAGKHEKAVGDMERVKSDLARQKDEVSKLAAAKTQLEDAFHQLQAIAPERDQYKHSTEALSQQVNQLNTELTKLRNECEAGVVERNGLRLEKEQVEKALESLSGESQALAAKLKDAQRENGNLQRKTEELTLEVGNLTQERDDLKTAQEKVEAQAKTAFSSEKEKDKEIKQLQSEIEQLKNEQSNLLESENALKLQVAKLQEESKLRAANVAKDSEALRTQIQQLTEELEQTRTTESNARAQLDQALREQRSQSQLKEAEAQREISTLKIQLEGAQHTADLSKETEISLRGLLEKTQADTRSKLLSLSQENDVLRHENNMLHTELEEWKSKETSIRSQYDRYQKESRSSSEQKESAQQYELQSLKDEVATLSAALATARENESKSQILVQSLRKEFEHKETTLNHEIETLRSYNNHADLAVEESRKREQHILKEFETAQKSLLEKDSDLRRELEKYRTEVVELRQASIFAKDTEAFLRDQIEKYYAEVQLLGTVKRRVEELEGELHASNITRVAAEEVTQRLRHQLETTTADASKLHATMFELEKVKTERETLSHQIDALRQGDQSRSSYCEQLLKDLRVFQSECETQRRVIADLESNVNVLEGEVARQRSIATEAVLQQSALTKELEGTLHAITEGQLENRRLCSTLDHTVEESESLKRRLQEDDEDGDGGMHLTPGGSHKGKERRLHNFRVVTTDPYEGATTRTFTPTTQGKSVGSKGLKLGGGLTVQRASSVTTSRTAETTPRLFAPTPRRY